MLNFKAKPIIAMLHLKGNSDEEIMERMMKETEIYYRNGIDAVLVENYFGNIKNWIYQCAESACPVFWKSPVRKEEIMVSDR